MFERIVAAIDSDPDHSARVVEAVKEIGCAFRSQVVVVHVREVERHAASMGAPTARASALPPVMHFESEESARELVAAAVAQLQTAGVRVDGQVGHGAAGSTAQELLDLAHAYGANLIVVGDLGSRVSNVLLGGVAHRIVHQADCSVFVVR